MHLARAHAHAHTQALQSLREWQDVIVTSYKTLSAHTSDARVLGLLV